MSTIQSTARPGLATPLRLPRRLVALALIVALAAVALTVTLVTAGGSDSAAPPAAHTAAQGQYFGGPAEGRNLQRLSPSARTNDGSQHSGARP